MAWMAWMTHALTRARRARRATARRTARDEEDEEDELVDLLDIGYCHDELLKWKNDKAGQFNTFHPAMINGGLRLSDTDLDNLEADGRLNIAKVVAKFFLYVDDPGSASESSSIYFRRLTYSKCPLVCDDVIITSAASIEKSMIKELIGGNILKVWLDELRQDTGKERFENSRSCRSVICNPGRNAKSDRSLSTRSRVGRSTGSPKDLSAAYADIDPDMDKVQPVLDFILPVHADGDQATFEYIMNWLTKMVGRREKMKTALLFFGPKGAGKDIIFERLFSRMYGAYYVHKCAKGVDTSFNSEFAGKLFVLWCEIEVTPGNVQQLKDMVSATTFVEHKKGKDIKARSCWRVCDHHAM